MYCNKNRLISLTWREKEYSFPRLAALLKSPQLTKVLPDLLRDARANIDALVDSEAGSTTTDPFISVYRMIFQFTMRTLACKEVADHPETLSSFLHCYEAIARSITPVKIMFPWVPTIGKVQSTYYVRFALLPD